MVAIRRELHTFASKVLLARRGAEIVFVVEIEVRFHPLFVSTSEFGRTIIFSR
jgi:hypothetical protein